MRYSVRPAKDSDRTWLDELRRAAYEELFNATWGSWDEDRHRRHFAASWERGNINVVEIDGHPIGMIQVLESEDRLEVVEIQIAPESQGTGVGTRLLTDLIARAKNENRDVVLSTGLMNQGAARLFRRLGFEETGRSGTHIHFRYNT